MSRYIKHPSPLIQIYELNRGLILFHFQPQKIILFSARSQCDWGFVNRTFMLLS
jgi:hypothetical protein